jgi:hypothetical protein
VAGSHWEKPPESRFAELEIPVMSWGGRPAAVVFAHSFAALPLVLSQASRAVLFLDAVFSVATTTAYPRMLASISFIGLRPCIVFFPVGRLAEMLPVSPGCHPRVPL